MQCECAEQGILVNRSALFLHLKTKHLYLLPSLSTPSLKRLTAVSPTSYKYNSMCAVLIVLDSRDKTEMWAPNHSNEGKNRGREWENQLSQGCDILSVTHRHRTSRIISESILRTAPKLGHRFSWLELVLALFFIVNLLQLQIQWQPVQAAQWTLWVLSL